MPPTPDAFRDCLILTGPTGSGKSSLALDLAEQINAEIIALDSMTLYRGMDIGTAKPSAADRARVPHHLIDVLDPWESASVAWYLEQAAACVENIQRRGKQPLFVGGTPFYLKAMLFGLFESPPTDFALRHQLEAEAERFGVEALHEKLAAVDPVTAQRLHPNDVRRVVRALEVFTLTGRPLSAFQSQWGNDWVPGAEALRRPSGQTGASKTPPLALSKIICLEIDRAELCARIDRRVEAMIAAGWLEEVRKLRELSRPLSREASHALGYRELGRVLDGDTTLAEAVSTIQLRSRQFAKRQMTWFRHLPGLVFVRPELTLLVKASTIE